MCAGVKQWRAGGPQRGGAWPDVLADGRVIDALGNGLSGGWIRGGATVTQTRWCYGVASHDWR
jgi:hypothetical protein